MTKDSKKNNLVMKLSILIVSVIIAGLLSGMDYTTSEVDAKSVITIATSKEPVLPPEEIKPLPEVPNEVVTSRGAEIFEVTAYDLSVQSCGKSMTHPAYGITASGRSLKGQTLESARAIAVDRNVIPLGTKVRITFKNPHFQHLNGTYEAVDTGSGVRGNHIDLFIGDFQSEHASEKAMQFGRQLAKVEIL